MTWLKTLFKELLSAFGFYWAGSEREKRKQSEAARDLEKQMADIAAGPDLDRDELYRRMRDRNGRVPKVPGPADGSGGDNVRGQ